MIDKNKPYEENLNIPIQQAGETNSGVEPLVNNPIESSVSTPTVVVPGNWGGVPKWLYFIFGITIIVFFFVTTLLVLQFTQKQAKDSAAVPTVALPKINPTIGYPTPTLTTSNVATDSAGVNLNDMSTSDDIASIEEDLKNTDLGVLDQSLKEVDTGVNNPF